MPQSLAFGQEPPFPRSVYDLNDPERFLVTSFRRWVIGLRENNGEHWSYVWNEFAREMGAHGGKMALASFAKLIRSLQRHARKTIYYHQPCCACLGADEAWVLCFLSACQHRQVSLATALLEWMVEPSGNGELLEAGAELGQLMEHHSLILPDRRGRGVFSTHVDDGSLMEPDLGLVTLH